ncbi:MAG: flagellar basal body-associated protein FliL [Candidatus Zixiibacteriota bacterium]
MKKKHGIMFAMLLVEVIVAYFVVDHMITKKDMELNPEKYPVEMTSYEFGELIVNPSESKGRRYFIANIIISYPVDSVGIPPRIEKNKPALTDTMMSVMMGKTITELSTTEGREDLRQKLENVFEEIIKADINKLLFKKYLIQ